MNRWIIGARPRTLPAAVVPVALGAAAAVGAGDDGIAWWRVVFALVVSLALQVGVNYANDYSDGVRGTDDVRVGPVRLVASGLASPRSVKLAAFVAFGVAGVCGLAIALSTSLWLLVVGAAAIAAAWFYTGGPKPYGYMGLGEVFVFVFFGLVATVGTTFAAIEELPGVAWLLGIGAGAIACALLVINNLRDIPTDRDVGKRTLAVRLGDARTRHFYVTLVITMFASYAAAAGTRPWVVICLLSLPLAARPIGTVRSGATDADLIPVLAATGRVQLVAGLLAAVGVALSG